MKKFMTIAFIAAAAFGLAAAEKLVYAPEFKKNADFPGWGSPQSYQKYKCSAADGVWKIAVEQALENHQSRIQPVVPCKYTFKSGVTYKFTGTLKANRALTCMVTFQQQRKPFKIFKSINVKLVKDTPYDYSFEYTPAEDITEPTRAPGLHLVMLSGDVLEVSSVKVFEVTK